METPRQVFDMVQNIDPIARQIYYEKKGREIIMDTPREVIRKPHEPIFDV